jgi:hypothetical protein
VMNGNGRHSSPCHTWQSIIPFTQANK